MQNLKSLFIVVGLKMFEPKKSIEKLKIIAVIPARYASTRFPGKPLEKLQGKEILHWVVDGARTSRYLDEIYVATDDSRIQLLCEKIKVPCIMTSSDCATGTDRLYQATENLEFDVVLNIQGDEPLINNTFIDPLAESFLFTNKNHQNMDINSKIDMATLAHPINHDDLANFNSVKVILNQNNEAIYFSRFPIPYSRQKEQLQKIESTTVLKHIGLYGYRREFLKLFCESPQAEIEKFESLEQLRALYLGAKIKVIQVNKPTCGVDTPEDLQKLEALLKSGLN